jgi:hypothetical protein
MALHASDIVAQGVGHHLRALRGSPSGHGRAVRVMAIGAVDGAFVDAVLEWQLESRANFQVAAVAGFAFRLDEQWA